jgi:hypothetical protein
MATVTASLAASGVVPKANHYTNILSGTRSGTLSISGQALLLMAKIPPNVKDLQLTVQHISGATTGVMNYGTRAQDGSLAASALGSSIASGVTHISPPIDVTWDDAGGETYKYVIASLVSGTVTASLVFNYQITYGF